MQRKLKRNCVKCTLWLCLLLISIHKKHLLRECIFSHIQIYQGNQLDRAQARPMSAFPNPLPSCIDSIYNLVYENPAHPLSVGYLTDAWSVRIQDLSNPKPSSSQTIPLSPHHFKIRPYSPSWLDPCANHSTVPDHQQKARPPTRPLPKPYAPPS